MSSPTFMMALWLFLFEGILFAILRRKIVEHNGIAVFAAFVAIVLLFTTFQMEGLQSTLVSAATENKWIPWIVFIILVGLCFTQAFFYDINPVSKTLNRWNKETRNGIFVASVTLLGLFVFMNNNPGKKIKLKFFSKKRL